MRESRFIETNRKKWSDYEKMLNAEDHDPEKLRDLFVELTDDLSYSRTFYERRSISIYLNNLAQRVFYIIYRNKSGRSNKLLYFWREELPAIIYECRTSFYLSIILFAIAFSIGLLTSINDPDFSRTVLGDDYVAMTIENIESGDPMAVYKKRSEIDMFLSITWNNLRVSFLTFVFGLLFGIGTIGILFSNGVMVGTFQYFFIEKDLFRESFLSIWLHGTIEISCIVIAGAAGITMGKGLLFPGTYTHLQSLQISAGRGLKIMIGIVPLFILAAFIEGFFTRYTDIGDPVRLCFIISSLILVLGYFAAVPWWKSRTGFAHNPKSEKVLPPVNRIIDLTEIKSSGELLTDLFYIYRSVFKKLLPIAILLAISLATVFTFSTVEIHPKITNTNSAFLFMSSIFAIISEFFNYQQHPLLFLSNSLAFAVFVFFITRLTHKYFDLQSIHDRNFSLRTAMPVLISIALLINAIFFFGAGWSALLITIAFPFLMISLFIALYEKLSPGDFSIRIFSLTANGGTFLLIFYLSVFLIGLVSFIILISPLSYFLFEFFQWNIRLEADLLYFTLTAFISFSTILAMLLILPVFVIGFELASRNIFEINDAKFLINKIENIGESGV